MFRARRVSAALWALLAALLASPAAAQGNADAAALSARAIAAIAVDPSQVQPAIAAAIAAAPGQTDAIIARVSRAFPYHAGAIAAAAGRPTPPQNVAYAPPLPAAPIQPARTYRAPTPTSYGAASTAQAIAAIAINPAGLEQIVAETVARAPERQAQIVGELSRAYPLFAPRIAAAAAGAPLTVAPAPAPASAPSAPPATQVAAATTPAPAPAADSDDEEPDPFDELEADIEALTPPGQEAADDPLEEFNRTVLSFNDGIDTILLRPIAWTYNALVPDVVIAAIGRAFKNLRSPVLLANDLLQGDFEDAAVTTGRFVVNSTAGVLGLFEVAEGIGLPAHHADFGQTLHSYGVDSGPYLMLPLLGPSTLRDGFGRVVDVLLDPLTWLVPSPESYFLSGAEVVVAREAVLEPLDDLKANAIDYYGALRSAYYQTRAVELRKGRAQLDVAPVEAGADALFDAAN